jgi:hypothetical protein
MIVTASDLPGSLPYRVSDPVPATIDELESTALKLAEHRRRHAGELTATGYSILKHAADHVEWQIARMVRGEVAKP